jgi:hypothetical protein
MAEFEGFGKPVMTNLPRELGNSIIRRILSTPRLDYAKLKEEAEKIEKQMLELRRQEDAQRNSAG